MPWKYYFLFSRSTGDTVVATPIVSPVGATQEGTGKYMSDADVNIVGRTIFTVSRNVQYVGSVNRGGTMAKFLDASCVCGKRNVR